MNPEFVMPERRTRGMPELTAACPGTCLLCQVPAAEQFYFPGEHEL